MLAHVIHGCAVPRQVKLGPIGVDVLQGKYRSYLSETSWQHGDSARLGGAGNQRDHQLDDLSVIEILTAREGAPGGKVDRQSERGLP